jgi:hypothetical protein
LDPSIVHRDLKPANLFIPDDVSTAPIKVLDLGIAKVMQGSVSATLLANQVSGPPVGFSPGYGAPEQFKPGKDGYGVTGPWTDVHALGLILVELVTGKPALDGSTVGALAMSALSARRPTPRARNAKREVSDGFEALCSKALALRPRDRYRTAGELLAAIDALLSVTYPQSVAATPRQILEPTEPRTLEPTLPLAEPTTGSPGQNPRDRYRSAVELLAEVDQLTATGSRRPPTMVIDAARQSPTPLYKTTGSRSPRGNWWRSANRFVPAILHSFVLFHLIGGLAIVDGPEALNGLYTILHASKPLLWLGRLVLLAATTQYIGSMVATKLETPLPKVPLWTGLLLVVFLIVHVSHLSVGIAPFDYVHSETDVYANIVNGFSIPIVSLFYMLGIALLASHLWRAQATRAAPQAQTGLGARHPKAMRAVFTTAVVAYMSIPIAVLLGIVR